VVILLKKLLVLAIFVLVGTSFINFAMASDPLDPDEKWEDHDNDGLLDSDEYQYGADPNNADSDNDGIKDGWEVEYGMNPADPTDAHLDFDYLESDVGNRGEIEATFSEVKYPYNVWPSDGVTQVAADMHYDNYEEYYRMTDHGVDNNGNLIKVPLHIARTNPIEADTDADEHLDPDDVIPKTFHSDGAYIKYLVESGDYDPQNPHFIPGTSENNQKLAAEISIGELNSPKVIIIEINLFEAVII
jgi:hypothetical protein